jgi:hypothetical protein
MAATLDRVTRLDKRRCYPAAALPVRRVLTVRTGAIHRVRLVPCTIVLQEALMSLTTILLIVLIVLLVGGGGYYWRR